MARDGKRMRTAREGIDRETPLPLKEAVAAVRERATGNFDQTIEIAVNLNIDTRKADEQVRGTVQLPAGTGKKIRVAVFARDAAADKAKEAGADVVGSEDLAERVGKGKIDFDRAISTPDMMSVVGKLGKVLGPRGLMPNPKLGTVTPDVASAVAAAKSGQVEFRAEKSGIIHAGIGKASFDEDSLVANVHAFVDSIRQARPTGVKGTFINKLWLASTMGPSVRIDVTKLEAEMQAATD